MRNVSFSSEGKPTFSLTAATGGRRTGSGGPGSDGMHGHARHASNGSSSVGSSSLMDGEDSDSRWSSFQEELLNGSRGDVAVFNDPDGFTASVLVEDVPTDRAFLFLSDPENLIQFNPSIMCLSSKDTSFPDRQGRQSMELDITYFDQACCVRAPRTESATFRVERTSFSVFLGIRCGRGRQVLQTFTIDDQGSMGSRIICKAVIVRHFCFRCRRSTLKEEVTQFLLALKETLESGQDGNGRASSPTTPMLYSHV